MCTFHQSELLCDWTDLVITEYVWEELISNQPTQLTVNGQVLRLGKYMYGGSYENSSWLLLPWLVSVH